MALKLYVRGAASAVAIPDLGITVAQGPSWTQLNYSSPGDAEGDSGQFTARELRDSGDLYDLIIAGTLQWSKDGASVETAGDYKADYMITEDFTDDFFDLSDGGLVFPNDTSLPVSGVEGQTFWDNDNLKLYVWDDDTQQWIVVGEGEDHGGLDGLGDDDHEQYLLLSGDLTRNTATGGADFSTASGLVIPIGTNTSGQAPTEGNIFWDSDDDSLWMYDGTQWITIATASGVNNDHGNLTGLGDDDHPQYLNETRHDGLPADNPHSVTFTQAVSADSGTDITTTEAETLTDGSNADSLHVHDHGNLQGNGDDDHQQYVFIDGDLTRNQFSTGGIDLASASGLIIPTGTDRTGLATVEGNIMWDTDDDNLWLYDGTQWVDIPMILSGVELSTDHGALFGLADDDHTQYVTLTGDRTRNNITGSLDLSGGDYFILPQATNIEGSFVAGEEGAIAWDSDDDILYAHDGTNWIGIAPASGIITDHGNLNGLSDDDHPQYTAWAQDETVTGVWTFNPVDDEPNLILDPRSDAPIYNNVDGAISIVGGILYTYDGTRGKWLSVDRTTYFGGRNGNATNIYLRTADNIATSATGIRMLRDGTITGLFAQTEGVESWTFEVRDSTGSVLTSLVISAAEGDEDATINVDVSAGDEIRLYVNGTGVVRPVAGFEVAWRI